MDAYLSLEAYRLIQALSLGFSKSESDGLVLGHKRGHRYFVEKIFPTQEGFFPSLKRYHDLDEFFEGKILGFFSSRTDEQKLKKILAPFAYRKLVLQINLQESKKIRIKAYTVDFDNEFFLSPVRLKLPKK